MLQTLRFCNIPISIVVIVAISLLIYYEFVVVSILPLDDNVANIEYPVEESPIAFAFGSAGTYSYMESFKCEASIESLARVAGFKGPIYLYTDETTCYDEKRMRRNGESNNIHLVNVASRLKQALKDKPKPGDVFNLRMNISTQQMPIKAQGDSKYQKMNILKTFILDEIIDPKIKAVMWYDCDVIFAKPNSASELVAQTPKFQPDKPFQLVRFPHVGSFAVSPQYGREALKAWAHEIIVENTGHKLGVPDFMAFSRLFEFNYTLLPPIFEDKFITLEDTPSDFHAMHLSNGRCENNHYGAENVQKLLENINLKSMKNRYWCPGYIRTQVKVRAYHLPLCPAYSTWL